MSLENPPKHKSILISLTAFILVLLLEPRLLLVKQEEQRVPEIFVEGAERLKIAVIEFKYAQDPKVDWYYDFWCDAELCIFRTPDQDPPWCDPGASCKTERKSFFTVFNDPAGITEIYPIGQSEPYYSYYSIYQLIDFYRREASIYGVDFDLTLEIKGPYVLAEKPPQRLRDEPPTELEAFFDNEAQKQGIELGSYDIINYVYFTSENYIVSTVSGNKTFNQAYISFDEFFGSIMTVAHEMGHVLGASDTYQPGSYSCRYPQGYSEPDRDPLYPQEVACLMCKSIMLGPTSSRAPRDFDELRICEVTAEAFGWTWIYTPTPTNTPIPTNTSTPTSAPTNTPTPISTPTPNPACRIDLDQSGAIGSGDLKMILAKWGRSCRTCLEDMNEDLKINNLDLSLVISFWGQSCNW